MSGFAVRNDGASGFRAVNSIDELYLYEVFSLLEPSVMASQPPTIEELSASAKNQRDKLLAIAANRMGPLQDAVDSGRANDEELTRLALWKDYRIDLNRIETQEMFPAEVQWPVSPDDAFEMLLK